MENNNLANVQPAIVEQANESQTTVKATNKPAKKVKKVESLHVVASVSIKSMGATSVIETPTFDLANLKEGFGKLLNRVHQRFTIRLLDKDIEVSGLTLTNDNKERVIKFFNSILTIIFGTLDADKEFTPQDGKAKYIVLTGMKANGWKVDRLTKKSFAEQFVIFRNALREKGINEREKVRENNAPLIAATNQLRRENKAMKAETDRIIADWENKFQKNRQLLYKSL